MKSALGHPVEVAVSGPLRQTFTYRWPDGLGKPVPGTRVVVPFGSRSVVGYYLAEATESDGRDLKTVSRIVDSTSRLDKTLFDLAIWVADYYFANPADALALAYGPESTRTKARFAWTGLHSAPLPPAIRRLNAPGKLVTPHARKLIGEIHAQYFEELIRAGCITEVPLSVDSGQPAIEPAHLLSEIERQPTSARDPRTFALTAEQANVYEQLRAAIGTGFSVHLLHGVTGSGKTLVYCHLCREILEQGRSVLVLTPEIALARSTADYFRAFFGEQVVTIHSALRPSERATAWHSGARGSGKIVIGPRSALFAPLQNLSLIVVDEEHDGSYKQHDPSPRLHARDTAIMRAKLAGIPILLGSASPSIESYQNARAGRYTLHELRTRPGGGALPRVSVIDMRTDRIPGPYSFLTLPLKNRIASTFERGEASILFLNRRGFASQLKCDSCGQVSSCPNCQVSLTYHKTRHRLQCHYCGHSSSKPKNCTSCGSGSLALLGTGTQKVESYLTTLLPGMRIERFDSDTASSRDGQRTLTRFAEGKIDLLVGTQLVTKGLDFPRVTLVGVVLADQILDMPDFRSSERGFAQLLQVSGRSGRGAEPGVVLVQTWYPEHPVLAAVCAHDYAGFFEEETSRRKELGYPPFSRIVNLEMSSGDEILLERSALKLRDQLLERIRAAGISATTLGPAPAAIYRVRGLYRRHMFVKARTAQLVTRMLTAWEREETRFGLPARVRIRVDVDPESMM